MTALRSAAVLLLAAVLAGPATPAHSRPDPAPADPAAGPRGVVVTKGASGRPTVSVRTTDSPAAARAALRREQARPEVVSVELDTRVSASAVTGAPDPLRPQQWGLRALRGPALWAAPQLRTVQVAVLDSGVDRNHPDLRGAVLPGVDLVAGGDGGTDPNGHGTHVAGVVAAQLGGGGVVGLAPRARILPVTVLDADGSGYVSDVAHGIIRAVDLGARVVNLSLSADAPSPAVQEAVAYAVERDVLVVAAVGNERLDGDPLQYPAATPGVLAVGSITEAREPAASSSTGPHVALAAPGESVLSTVPGGWATASGSSMAAPHVSAAAAVLLAARVDLTADQVRDALVATALDLDAPGRDDRTGAGVVRPVQALAAVGVPVRARASTPVVRTGLPRDLDADGRTDLLTVHDGALVRYEGSGTGTFAGRTVVGGGWAGIDLVVPAGDWDGDGRHDLIARTRVDARLLLYSGNGLGGFRRARQIGSGWGAFDEVVAPTDWNGDGTPDLVARRAADGALFLYPGTGRGGFGASQQVLGAQPDRHSLVVVGDWDADGAADLAHRDGAGRLVLLPGDGVGGVATPEVIGTGWTGTRLAGPGDWNGDRRPDLLSVAPDGTLRLYPSDGTGGFGRARVIGSGWSAYRMAT